MTTINGSNVAFVTTGPVKAITVTYGTGTVNNFEKIILTGPGLTTGTTVTTFGITIGTQQNLGLSVNGVDNSGPFTLTTNGNIGGPGLTPAQINSPTIIGVRGHHRQQHLRLLGDHSVQSHLRCRG